MEKKDIKKAAAAFLAAVMILLTLTPSAVFAGTTGKNYTIVTLKPGKWASNSYRTSKKGKKYYQYYKISVAKAGQLTFSLSGSGIASLYKSKSDMVNNGNNDSSRIISHRDQNKSVAVEKGTYYLEIWNVEAGKNGKGKYSFKAAGKAGNYSIATAKGLKANKAVSIMFTPKTNYDRWFKISVGKKKKIAFLTNHSDYGRTLELYDSEFESIEMTGSGADLKTATKKAQPKGTYYVRIRSKDLEPYHDDYLFGDALTLKWW